MKYLLLIVPVIFIQSCAAFLPVAEDVVEVAEVIEEVEKVAK